MNKILSILIFAFIPLVAFSANSEKEYKKLLGKYDVADEAKAVQKNSPAAFWKAVLDNNEYFRKFVIDDMHKNGGAEKEALQKYVQIPRFYPQYDESVISELQGFCDTMLIDMGIADLNLKCSLHVVYSDEFNAFTTLTENGFAMCLTTALIQKKGVNYKILMGYVAHEFAHGALYHHLRSFYAEAKESRKNKLLGGIAAGLNAVAAGAEAYNAGAYGVPRSGTNYEARIENIKNEVKNSTLKYSFQYSREQEIEADLFAYRFLENLGCAEEFINGLRILGTTQYDEYYSEYSDHPTTPSRISFLKFVQEHPELGNTDNIKLRKKRSKPQIDW